MAGDQVRIELDINASAENVWAAWTELRLILKWFGSDPNGKGIKAIANVYEGGSYEITFHDSNGTEHTCMGKYLTVEKFKRLSFTWEWKNEPGVISSVSVLLIPNNNITLMIFEHKDLGKASAHNYLAGWNSTFEKLKNILLQ